MSAYAVKHFDLLSFVKRSKELGASEPLAEYQGRQIEEAMEMAIAASHEAIETRGLATKEDIQTLKADIKAVEAKIQAVESRLELKIEQAKNHLIFWLVGLLLASGVITHFLK
jgi:hypothetical protein